MMVLEKQHMTTELPYQAARRGFPQEVQMILSALEAARHWGPDRRSGVRSEYHALAKLRLFSDPEGTGPRTLYTRDVNPRGLGFVTNSRLPLGYGGVIEFHGPRGEPLAIHCTLLAAAKSCRNGSKDRCTSIARR